MKYGCETEKVIHLRRSPCGERGLKLFPFLPGVQDRLSLPVRGAWIEINQDGRTPGRRTPSLPVRGAWIEMPCLYASLKNQFVAPRAGSVD